MKRSLLLLVLLSCGGSPAGGGSPGGRRGLTVAAASSLRELLTRTASGFSEAGTHPSLEFSFEASSTLARQIAAGAPFDALLSADPQTLERIGRRLVGGSRRVFLESALALVGRAGLRDPPLGLPGLLDVGGKIALAGPAVPAGRYARSYLRELGLWERLRDRVVTARNVRAALALVEAGAADYAVVYRTDARIAKRARTLWAAGAKEGPLVRYVAAIVRGGREELAARYLDYLASPAFRREAEALGFRGVEGR